MTSASNHEDHAEHVLELARGPGRRSSLAVRRTAAAIAALLGLAVLAAGCGGSNNRNRTPASSGGLMAQFLAVSRCMRSHGVPDFPDPTTSGGVGIVLPHVGPGSDLNPDNPKYKAANQACQALGPVAHPTTASAPKLAAEVKVARCMRSHGLPSFPDPNGQGQFDRKLDESSPAFKTAYNACKSLIAAAGPLTVVK
jgi:hypothetical protein